MMVMKKTRAAEGEDRARTLPIFNLRLVDLSYSGKTRFSPFRVS